MAHCRCPEASPVLLRDGRFRSSVGYVPNLKESLSDGPADCSHKRPICIGAAPRQRDLGPLLTADLFDDLQMFCLNNLVANCQCVLLKTGPEQSFQYNVMCDPYNRIATIPAIQACKDRCVCGQTLQNQRLDVTGSSEQAAEARQGLNKPKPAIIHT